eukprot:1139217-Pelagomonas_calceolata.AAC.4
MHPALISRRSCRRWGGQPMPCRAPHTHSHHAALARTNGAVTATIAITTTTTTRKSHESRRKGSQHHHKCTSHIHHTDLAVGGVVNPCPRAPHITQNLPGPTGWSPPPSPSPSPSPPPPPPRPESHMKAVEKAANTTISAHLHHADLAVDGAVDPCPVVHARHTPHDPCVAARVSAIQAPFVIQVDGVLYTGKQRQLRHAE